MSEFLQELLGLKKIQKNNNKGTNGINLDSAITPKTIYDIKEINLPVKDISDLVIGTDNKYKLIFKVSPVNGELLSEDDLSAIQDSIQSALANIEGRIGLYIQTERVNIEQNLAYIEKRKQEANSELDMMLLEEQKSHLSKMTSKSRNVLSFYIAIETKANNYASAEQLLSEAFLNMKNELEASEMYCERLFESDIKELLYYRLNPEQSQDEPICEEWELPDILTQNAKRYMDGRHIEIENEVYRFFSITKYPKKVDEYRWLKKLLKFKGNMFISLTLTPKNKATISKELSEAADELEAKAKDEKLSRDKRIEHQAEVDSAERMIEELSSDNTMLYDTCIVIGIAAPDVESLNTYASSLRGSINAMRCQCTELKYKGFDPFFTTLPILAENRITKNYVWNFSSADIASMIIFDSSELMENKGTLVGENVTSNGLVITDPRNKIYNNAHTCVVADPGSGKSFFLMTDVLRQKPYVDYTFIFDIKGDLIFPFGERYVFNPKSGLVTNPFHIRNAILDSESELENGRIDVGNYLVTKIMELIVFFKWIIKDMDEITEAVLEEDIRETYKTICGLDFNSKELPDIYPTLSDFNNVIDNKIQQSEMEEEKKIRQRIKLALKPYVTGAYSVMFNGQTTWEFEPFTVFDISSLPLAVRKPMYDLLLKDTWQFCKKDGTKKPTKKNVYIDECHEFADITNPQTLEFISVKLIKEGRGFGVRCFTATQNLPDLLSIPRYGQAIIDNSYFKLFMRLGESDLPVAQKLYRFSDEEMKVLQASTGKKKGAKGRGIFIVGSQRVIIQTRASKFELEIIDPVQYEEIYKTPSRFIKGKKLEVS